MSRKAKPGLELSLTCTSAGQEDPAGLSEWLAVRSEPLTSRFKLIFSIQECILEPSTVFFCAWPREMAGLIPGIRLKCQYLYLHGLSRLRAAPVSVCRSKTISHVKWTQTNCFGEPGISPLSTGPDTQKVLRGKSSARNTFSILGDVVMFSLLCQETSFFTLH